MDAQKLTIITGYNSDGTPIRTATNPNYNVITGVYEQSDYPATVEYTWVHENNTLKSGNNTLTDNQDGTHTIKTNENIEGLGRVTGKVTLNITGNTIVKGKKVEMDKDGYFVRVVTEKNDDDEDVEVVDGGVFGGGDASDAEGDVEVIIDAPTQKDNGENNYNAYRVFGGGNNAEVYGNTVIKLYNGKITSDVFGGGNKGDVRGSATVNIRPEAPQTQNGGQGQGQGGN